MLWIFREAGKRNPKNTNYQFWLQDNQPKDLETNHFKDEKLSYLHHNPVEAGFVSRPEDWVIFQCAGLCRRTGLAAAGVSGIVFWCKLGFKAVLEDSQAVRV